MIRRPPRSTRTDTLFPYTTLFRSYYVFTIFHSFVLTSYPKFVSSTGMHREYNPHIYTPVQKSLEYMYNGFHFIFVRSEEHTSELQSLMRISYAVFCLKKKNNKQYDKLRSSQY